MTTLFEGTNFVVRDLRETIDEYRCSGYPSWWHGRSSKGSQHLIDPRTVNIVVFHQNYGNILPGEQGPIATAQFITRNPVFKCTECDTEWTGSPSCRSCPNGHPGQSKRVRGGRGFPKLPYHVWVPFKPLKDNEGRWIVYQCLGFNERSSHTPGANAHGIAVCVQGMHYSRHLGKKFRPWPGTDGRMSEAQAAVVPRLFPEWLSKHPDLTLGAKDIAGHFMFGKAACPGDEVEHYVRIKRGESVKEPNRMDYVEKAINDPFDSWKERQTALVVVGYHLGGFGDNKDGVDGLPGDATRQAITDFQEDMGLVADGMWGRQTEKAMYEVFEDNDLDPSELSELYAKTLNPPAPAPAGDATHPSSPHKRKRKR